MPAGFGGRPRGKGPARQVPRRVAYPVKHRLGAVVKLSGQNSFYEQGGYTLKTSGAEANWTYPGPGLSNFVYNRVNYRKYVRGCSYTTTAIQWRKHSFYALGTDRVSVSRPNWTACA